MRLLLLAGSILLALTSLARADTVSVCSGHGCAFRAPVTFTASDMGTLKRIMAGQNERAGIARAIAWMERKSGAKLGITDSQASLPPLARLFTASGLASQQDCVDEATNTLSYLRLLARHGLLKQHTVLGDVELWRGWPHHVAAIRDVRGGVWLVDSDVGTNGTPPIITKRQR